MKVSSSSRALCIAVVLTAVSLLATGNAEAQNSDRDKARALYQQGLELFNDQQYLAAIDKYQKADALAPAPLLSFNIGLAYDRAGDKASALKHYRRYLSRAPNARNRDAVQAKINRIEGELRAEANKRAEEEAARRKAAEEAAAKKAAEEAAAKKAAEEAAAKKAAEEAASAEKPASPYDAPATSDPAPADPPAGGGAGTTGAPTPPAAGQPDPFAPTGDPELDNVGAIDVTAIRARRGLSSRSSRVPASRGGTAAAAPPPRGGAAPAPSPLDQPKAKKKAIYKQWWFWVVVGVSAVILIDIASTGDGGNNATRLLLPADQSRSAQQGGAVLMRF